MLTVAALLAAARPALLTVLLRLERRGQGDQAAHRPRPSGLDREHRSGRWPVAVPPADPDRQQGLAVRIRWRPSEGQPPGTVLSVRPAGPRPVGSLVTLTAALTPGQGGDQQGGDGQQGNGNGDGHGHPGGDSGVA